MQPGRRIAEGRVPDTRQPYTMGGMSDPSPERAAADSGENASDRVPDDASGSPALDAPGSVQGDPRDPSEGAPDEASENPPLDAAVLDDLRSTFGDDSETLRALFDLFLEGSQEHLGRAERALNAGDFAALRGAAHSLKGNCGIVGAGTLHARAVELETAGVGKDPDTARRKLAAAQKEFARVREALISQADRLR